MKLDETRIALSTEQIALRDRITGLRESLNKIQKILWAAERECREHVYAPSKRGLRACCVICVHDGGWYCPESPSHACEYDWETNGENCVHCGEPKVRK